MLHPVDESAVIHKCNLASSCFASRHTQPGQHSLGKTHELCEPDKTSGDTLNVPSANQCLFSCNNLILSTAKYKEAVRIDSGVVQQKLFASQRFAKSLWNVNISNCLWSRVDSASFRFRFRSTVRCSERYFDIIATAAALKFVCVSRIIRRGASFDVAARCRSCAALDFASLSDGSGICVC